MSGSKVLAVMFVFLATLMVALIGAVLFWTRIDRAMSRRFG